MSAPRPADADDSFQVVLLALHHGDDAAWQEVLSRYSMRLVALARSRLFDPRLRQKLDPEDVVQSVWRTFYRRHRDKPFPVASWDALWGLLMTLTVHRICKWDQYFNTQKRALDRETPLAPPTGEDRDPAAPPLIDPNPTPAEVAQFTEMIQERLASLDPQQRRMVELGLLGLEDSEIADQAGRTEARVRQVREDFVQELLGLLDNDQPPNKTD
jgi:DNA-directed RNA polymerase specialized sigma24 family protein